jgi:hypothetical protein
VRVRADTRPRVCVCMYEKGAQGGGRVDGWKFSKQNQQLAASTPYGRGVDVVDGLEGGGDRTDMTSGRDQPAGHPKATKSRYVA